MAALITALTKKVPSALLNPLTLPLRPFTVIGVPTLNPCDPLDDTVIKLDPKNPVVAEMSVVMAFTDMSVAGTS